LNIFITGANGFLGSALARTFLFLGHSVTGTCRVAAAAPTGIAVQVYALGEPVPPELVRDCQAVIHCAHDFSPGARELNVRGTLALMHAASALAEKPYQLFVSSDSAHPGTPSEYGAVKYEIEQCFLQAGHAIVRPGLVVGHGGMFLKRASEITRTPILPLLDGGRDRIPAIALADLTTAVARLVQSRTVGAYNLFNPELVSIRQFADTVLQQTGHRATVVSLPSAPVLQVLRLAQWLGLPLPMDPNSIAALKYGQTHRHESHLLALVPDCETFDKMVALCSPAFLTDEQ